MYHLLIATNLILFALSFILIRNRFLFRPLQSVPGHRLSGLPPGPRPSVTVCIPARNEENTIQRCVESILAQNYDSVQVFVLNDHSEDATGEILDELVKANPEKLRIFQGKRKPEDWLGKQWACNQLTEYATTDLLVFADADTWFEPDAILKTVSAFEHYDADMLTVWPRQYLETFWEKTLIPLVYYSLLSFLPTHYTYRKPLWMPALFYRRFGSVFAAACGQFIAFRSFAYHSIGGHTSVRNEVVEDVELARLTLKNKMKVLMLHGKGTVNCRMYTSQREIREGFRKNFLAGFRYNIPLFILSAIVHILVFVFPFAVPFLTADPTILLLSVSAIVLILLHRLLLATWFNWDFVYILTHPIGVLWFQFLGITVLSDYLFKRKITWKNRSI
ncbi:MAG: glycosyltransferase [Cyclonatronaceae bacterium]